MPNPMQCPEDITLFNSFIQRQRLYQFLAGVNDSLDKEKRDLLNHDPLPSIDAAYAFIRREIARRGIMTGVSSSGQNPSGIGSGLVANRRSESSFRREDKTHLKCTHCGGTKHTKKGCFEIIGYPEWWEEYTKKKAATKAGAGGKASVAVYSNPESTGSGNISDNISGNTGISGMREEENDALTGRIIGRGTERGGLYYVDEEAQQGNALLAHGSPESQLWMWHRRLGPQGENLSDDLSWLTYPKMVNPDPTTQVGNTTDATPETVVPLPLQSPPDPPNEHPSDDIPSSEEVPSESSPVSYNMPEINPVSNESEQNRYELPPRSTREVPPRRYDPEYEDQRSRYPIEIISTENLSSTSIAFNASLYSADIPKNVEEAVKNEKWKQAMEEEQSNSDHTLFLKKEKEKITCLIIYVDDMIITGNDEEEIADLKGKLFQEFEMKDLGNLKYFLGIEVLRSKQGIFIHQRKYILDLLAETGMLGCKPAETPIVANHGLQILEGAKLTNKEQYQKIVGKLIYLAHTRPDIAYAVGVVSRFMHLPQVQHMTAVMRILRYLKGTSSTGIYFDKNDHLDLIAYTDADWAGGRDGRKSTSGYFTLVGGNLVTWRSKKQKVVALSSAEAEFR
uniref:Reverse transcriptase Ty1/copia-type domain-containing protein n=1 Tax=Chenopodium quinoa TaxID=63459 RepID=A0A803KYB0_CHEQI